MSNQTTIDVEATATPAETENKSQTMALQRSQAGALAQPLSVDELHERLEFIRQVMKREMKENQDFGKIPGTGEKPSLLQPGAQKLLMTFNLREQIKKEVLREIPHPKIMGHREYEFTLVVFPAGSSPEQGWDGVGTCSTLESKYRYRKAERKCPKCGKATIIAEKPEYVRGREPGFCCWKKRGGCGEVFHKEHPDIVSQPAEDVENEDPADCWNTVRKMAFKRALVAAAINATNTSELWTQDVEDLAELRGSGIRKTEKTSQDAPGQKRGVSTSTRDGKASGPQSGAGGALEKSKAGVNTPPPRTGAKPAIFADAETRNRMVRALEPCKDLALEYFQKLHNPALLLPNETLEDVPLQWVPVTKRQFEALQEAITAFGNGEEAKHPYQANPLPPEKGKKEAPPPAKTGEAKPKQSVAAAKAKDPEWFFDVVCPIPRKGMRRDDYLKAPDTIGSLYDALKEGDKAAQSRLWGFARHWQPEARTVGDKTYPITDADELFREALDAFCDWEEKHGKDTQNPDAGESHAGTGMAGAREQQADPGAGTGEDDLPF